MSLSLKCMHMRRFKNKFLQQHYTSDEINLNTEKKEPDDLLESPLCEGGALQVPHSPDLVCQLLPLLALDGGVAVIGESLQRLLVLPQIYLGSCKWNMFISHYTFGCSDDTY